LYKIINILSQYIIYIIKIDIDTKNMCNNIIYLTLLSTLIEELS